MTLQKDRGNSWLNVPWITAIPSASGIPNTAGSTKTVRGMNQTALLGGKREETHSDHNENEIPNQVERALVKRQTSTEVMWKSN